MQVKYILKSITVNVLIFLFHSSSVRSFLSIRQQIPNTIKKSILCKLKFYSSKNGEIVEKFKSTQFKIYVLCAK